MQLRIASRLILSWICSSALFSLNSAIAQISPNIRQATLREANQSAPEISTEELEKILTAGRIPVLDVRSAQEYAIAHIPGTRNLYEKEVDHVIQLYPDTATELVLYCNGPFCGKSKRLSAELAKRGYSHIRRYQLGLPVWRALGNTVQTDLAGARYMYEQDHTAVWVDARPGASRRELPGEVHIHKGEAEKANDDGRLPNKDKGTRIVVFGDTPAEARVVAEEVAHKAYWNSSYFGGKPEDLFTLAKR